MSVCTTTATNPSTASEALVSRPLPDDDDIWKMGDATRIHPTMSSSRARHFAAEYFRPSRSVAKDAVVNTFNWITTVNMGAPIRDIAYNGIAFEILYNTTNMITFLPLQSSFPNLYTQCTVVACPPLLAGEGSWEADNIPEAINFIASATIMTSTEEYFSFLTPWE